MPTNIENLQKLIKYHFNDILILKKALTHPSYANENNINKYNTNQRLEFLGDSVLEFISSDFLYATYSNFDEGQLTKIRSQLVCEENLSNVAREINLYDYILIGKGESIEKIKHNNSIMCDAIEALIGAIYIDSNIDNAKKFILKFILTEKNLNKIDNDYKSKIQEYANSKNLDLEYVLADEFGPDHDKTFKIDLLISKVLYGSGIGKSKKEAEQLAAKSSLIKLEENNVFKTN